MLVIGHWVSHRISDGVSYSIAGAAALYTDGYISSRVLVRRMRGQAPADVRTVKVALNFREQQILDCAAKGMTNHEIAETLGIAVPTTKNYMSRIFEKINVRNRAEAIAMKFNTAQKEQLPQR
jgi:DNA-binding NarL/FixJ family response regulator